VSCGNLRSNLSHCIDKILGIREQIGAQLADVDIVQRTWSGQRQGDGSFTDVVTRLSPAPEIVDYSHNIRTSESGAIKSGDLILRGISPKYTEDQLKTQTDVKNKEKFYKLGAHYYTCVHVRERLVTWDVHIRKVSQDETERG
jgi:hypothetical protein